MTFPLASIVSRQRNIRRKAIAIREIRPTGVMATSLYQAAYVDVIRAWSDAMPAVNAEYERSLSALQTDSAVDLGQFITQTDGLITRLLILIRPALREAAERIERWHRGKWRGAILTATGVDIQVLIGPEAARETIAAFVERNAGLVRSVSDEIRRRIETAAFQGLSQRKPARDVAREISVATGLGRKRALRIASDQMSKLAGELDRERRREAGLTVWEWRHSGKRHPRAEHLARNGKYYSEVAGNVGRVIEGHRVHTEPPADDLPSMAPFCGCTSRSVLVLEDL